MFLLDTNIWLEVLLDQKRADEAARLIQSAVPGSLHISEFALNSIGNRLSRLHRPDLLEQFIEDMFTEPAIVQVVRLEPLEHRELSRAIQEHQLDFDDAYQFTVARLHGLRLVSFDTHFDHVPGGRLEPAQALHP